MGDQIPTDIAYCQSNNGEGIDRYLDALSSRHRRQTLRYLNTTQQSTVDEIAEHLTSHERDEDVEDVKIELVHTHLPVLRDYGLVSFDHRSKSACREPLPELVGELLELTQESGER